MGIWFEVSLEATPTTQIAKRAPPTQHFFSFLFPFSLLSVVTGTGITCVTHAVSGGGRKKKTKPFFGEITE